MKTYKNVCWRFTSNSYGRFADSLMENHIGIHYKKRSILTFGLKHFSRTNYPFMHILRHIWYDLAKNRLAIFAKRAIGTLNE